MREGWDDRRLMQWAMLLAGSLLAFGFAPSNPGLAATIAVTVLAFAFALACGAWSKPRAKAVRPAEQELSTQRLVTIEIGNARQDQVSTLELLAQSVQETLNRNQSVPMVREIAHEVSQAVTDLVTQAMLIDQRRMEVESFVDEPSITVNELDDLRKRIASERNDGVRQVLAATLDRKSMEKDNYEKMSESLRYMDVLLESAQATISELRSRIGVAVATSDDYTNPELVTRLQETSSDIRSVSETMRQTLKEIR